MNEPKSTLTTRSPRDIEADLARYRRLLREHHQAYLAPYEPDPERGWGPEPVTPQNRAEVEKSRAIAEAFKAKIRELEAEHGRAVQERVAEHNRTVGGAK